MAKLRGMSKRTSTKNKRSSAGSSEAAKEARRNYYQAHKEEILARGKDYYKNNKEKYKKWGADWRKNNPEKVAQYGQNYRENHGGATKPSGRGRGKMARMSKRAR